MLTKTEELKVIDELENNSDPSSDTDEEESKFPDTQIKIQHFSGTK